MILKGSQRAGATQLALHLINDRDNDHVTLFELRGFMASDLRGALNEAYAVSKGTRCQQFMFSLSLNPPKGEHVTEDDLVRAADRAEAVLGLDNQPRAIVFHEKENRRHAHVVWSRIDASTMTAINLPHFKRKLNDLARELYLDHEWELPNGLRRDGGKSPLNFTLDEWQQAKRIKLDPREIKQSFLDAWQRSDSAKGFKAALEERGYFLARGDRRGFVALDTNGEVFSVPRWVGVKTKEVRQKLGDPQSLPNLGEVKRELEVKITDKVKSFIGDVDRKHDDDMLPLAYERTEMVANHRQERKAMHAGQRHRWQTEARERSSRLNKGLRGLWQTLSGASEKIKSQNTKEAWAALKRDQKQRDDLVKAHMAERRSLQQRIESLRRKHAQNRRILTRDVAQAWRTPQQRERPDTRVRQHIRTYRGPSL